MTEQRPLSSEEIMEYVHFCFRSDVIKKLRKTKHPHVLAIQLFKKETGKDIPLKTSHQHLTRWMLSHGQLLPRNTRK